MRTISIQKVPSLPITLCVSALSAIVAIVYTAHFFQGIIDQLSQGLYLILPVEIADWIMSIVNNISVPGSIPSSWARLS